MANQGWKLWLVPFGLWGLYACWHSGYQSGYADGHETAWNMSRPSFALSASNAPKEVAEVPAFDEESVTNQ